MKALFFLVALSSPALALELDPEIRGPDPVCKPAVVALTVEQACHDDMNCAPGSKCLGGRCVVGGQCLGDVDCTVGMRCVSGSCR